jgi:hypothetical protein
LTSRSRSSLRLLTLIISLVLSLVLFAEWFLAGVALGIGET